MDRIERALTKAKSGQRVVRLRPAAQAAPPAPPPTPAANDTVRNSATVRSSPSVLKRMRVVAATHDSVEADLFRMLRTRVLQKLSQANHRSLAIVSPSAAAGKTLTAANLATSIAKDLNHTVLLVDLDLRRPRVHSYFGLRPEHGIADYLTGKAELTACLIHPGIERLVLLPGRGSHKTSSEMLTSPRMTSLSKELRDRYLDRIVVYDLPPLLTTDDAISFLPQVEACLMVVREGGSTKGELEQALALVADANLIGTVLNDSNEKISNRYYG